MYLRAFSAVGSLGESFPVRSMPVKTIPVIPGLRDSLQLPSSDCWLFKYAMALSVTRSHSEFFGVSATTASTPSRTTSGTGATVRRFSFMGIFLAGCACALSRGTADCIPRVNQDWLTANHSPYSTRRPDLPAGRDWRTVRVKATRSQEEPPRRRVSVLPRGEWSGQE